MSAFASELGANFQEPSSPDTTSARPEPQLQQQTPGRQTLAQALSTKKKKKLAQRSAALQAAISRARRARPSSLKWG